MTPLHRRIALFLGLILAVTVGIVPVAAHDGDDDDDDDRAALPARIDLPNGFRPEGIESGKGGRLYVGSLADGAIWTGDPRTGKERILVPGVAGQVAVGLNLDSRGRLWVAGGPNGTIRVYRARTGKLLQTYTFPTTGFLNDVVVSRGAVYATDSVNQQLAVVPLGKHGRLPGPTAARTLRLTGDLAYTTGFNANGIAARGRWLILVQSNTGLLFRVNPRTGRTASIDTGGYLVTNGDGLELRGRTLYVVRNFDNLVAVLKLSHNLRRATKVGDGEITSPGLDIPTTATLALGALWAVNARFSTPPMPDTAYWITRLPTRP